MTIKEIHAPLPGVLYRQASPDDPPYKKEGDRVEEGDILCLIEVMKTYNQVVSDVRGTLTKFHVENEAPIAPGQVIAEIETE